MLFEDIPPDATLPSIGLRSISAHFPGGNKRVICVGAGILLVDDILVCHALSEGVGHDIVTLVVVQVEHGALLVQFLEVAVYSLLGQELSPVLTTCYVTVNIDH